MTLNPLAGVAGSLSLVLLVSPTSFAAEDDHMTIVITGSRNAQTVDESLAPVTVINREEIEQRPNASVTDLLKATPSLNVVSNGGKGAQASIFMRGTESDQVLILIDGVRVGSATTGTAAIQDIPTSQIERIEVVRGPRSSLYGSEAIGGVIQLFTRRPESGKTRADFSVSGGSEATGNLNLGLSGRQDSSWYNIQLSSFTTDGIDACRGKPFPDGGGCFTIEPDEDGYSNDSIALAGGIRLGSRVNASVNFLNIDSKLDFDGDFVNQSEATNQVVSGKLEIAASDIWSMDLLLSRSQDQSDNFKDGMFTTRFNSDRDQLSFQNDILAGKQGKVTLGMDYYEDQVDGTTTYLVESRNNTGVFAQYLGDMAGTDVQLSLRNDDNEQFANVATGGVSIGRDFAGTLRWTAAYGTAFKAPTFNELYFPGFGNPALDAETSDSIDLGVSGTFDTLRFSANLFDTRIDQLITYDALLNLPVNVDEAHIQGLELGAATRLADWNIDLNYTVLSTQNDSGGPNDGNHLARRPKHSFNLALARDFGKLSTLLDLHAQGHSYDDLANTRELAGFTTVDLNLGYTIASDWRLNLAINNLLDKEYETAAFYNQEGINGLLTLSYSPR